MASIISKDKKAREENLLDALKKSEVDYHVCNGMIFILNPYPPQSIMKLAAKLKIELITGAMWCDSCERIKAM